MPRAERPGEKKQKKPQQNPKNLRASLKNKKTQQNKIEKKKRGGKEKHQDEGSDKASKGRETKGVGTKDELEQSTKEGGTKALNRKQRRGDKKSP